MSTQRRCTPAIFSSMFRLPVVRSRSCLGVNLARNETLLAKSDWMNPEICSFDIACPVVEQRPSAGSGNRRRHSRSCGNFGDGPGGMTSRLQPRAYCHGYIVTFVSRRLSEIMSKRNHNLPIVPDRSVVENKIIKGQRIVVASSAGPRLAGRSGIVTGKGTTKSQVRVLLDGSKSCITLHARFVDLLQNLSDLDETPPARV
jgi:hypothetical protein